MKPERMRGRPHLPCATLVLATALVVSFSLLAVPALAQESPQPPGGLWAADRPDDGGGKVDLGWTDSPSSDIAAYRVYRSTRPGGPYEYVGRRSTDAEINYLGYVDVDLSDGTTYYYVVTAVDDLGRESVHSREASAVPSAQRVEAAITIHKSMVISLAEQKLYCMENGRVVYVLLVSTGTSSNPTPTGNFRILYHDAAHPVPKYPGCVCYYWMGFYDEYAIHAWPSYNGAQGNYSGLGRPASHGCVRLDPNLAHLPFYWAPDGTPLTIIAGAFQPPQLPINGGHVSMGTAEASDTWYFAEGYTGSGFNEYLLVFNPEYQTAGVNFELMLPDGSTHTYAFTVGPRSRFTLNVDDLPGMADTNVSALVTSDVPVVAERAMYFDYNFGKTGGHVAPGVREPSDTWYFAEGYTGGGFDEYILVLNPQDQPARVDCDFMLPDGGTLAHSIDVGPRSRATVYVDAVPGLEGTDVSARLRSDLPVVAERSMYFGYPEAAGGHVTPGSTSPGRLYLMAEGNTSDFYDTYLLIMNPGDETIPSVITFCQPSGGQIGYPLWIGAHSRVTVKVNAIPGLDSSEFSIRVDLGGDAVVERAMYFNYPR